MEVWSVPPEGLAAILVNEPAGLAIGKIKLEDGSTVLGVMRPGFKGLSFDTDVWFPAMMAHVNGAPPNGEGLSMAFAACVVEHFRVEFESLPPDWSAPYEKAGSGAAVARLLSICFR